jgi:hypothetical protein
MSEGYQAAPTSGRSSGRRGVVMDQTPKHVKRAIREMAGRAYEIELSRELAALEDEFSRWHRGDITAFDVSEAIHRFHQGPARELYLTYTQPHPKGAVASAIYMGILDRTQIAPDVLEELAGALSMYGASNSAQ